MPRDGRTVDSYLFFWRSLKGLNMVLFVVFIVFLCHLTSYCTFVLYIRLDQAIRLSAQTCRQRSMHCSHHYDRQATATCTGYRSTLTYYIIGDDLCCGWTVVDGWWGSWDECRGTCSVRFGQGISTRTRRWDWPAAQRGGVPGAGDSPDSDLILSTGADSMGYWGHVPPLYKWLCTGDTVRWRAANKKLAILYWPSRKS